MQNNYEKLRKLVYGIIHPEGIPLEFGVQIEKSGDIFTLVQKNSDGDWRLRFDDCDYVGVCRIDKKTIESPSVKILGKPLTIADILVAIQKAGICVKLELNPRILMIDSCDEITNLDLSKPISEQSKSTINSLIELFG